MSRPMVRIHNTETNEVVDREMNNNEFAQYKEDQAAQAIAETIAQAKAQAKATAQSKLATLGLTLEDLQALGL